MLRRTIARRCAGDRDGGGELDALFARLGRRVANVGPAKRDGDRQIQAADRHKAIDLNSVR
jgi:hypothetical protein